MLSSPDVVEVAAIAGMDYVIVDTQHVSPDWSVLGNMVRSANATGIACIVRIPNFAPEPILKVLELGVDGIALPFVRSAEDIQSVLDIMKFPPDGKRSSCQHTRSARYSSLSGENYREHMRQENERLALLAIAEDPITIASIGELAALEPGADAIGIGRGDLSTALGHPGQYDHPVVVEATERAIAEITLRSKGKCAPLIQVRNINDIPVWLKKGCRMITYAADTWMLMEAARSAVEGFRSALNCST